MVNMKIIKLFKILKAITDKTCEHFKSQTLISIRKMCVCVCVCVCVYLVTQLFPLFVTFWTCSPPGSSVHGTMQARILGLVAISYSRGSSQSRGQTCISLLQVDSLPAQPLGKPACVCVCVCVCAQSCLTFCDPTDLLCPWDSLGKKLEWVLISSSM